MEMDTLIKGHEQVTDKTPDSQGDHFLGLTGLHDD